MELWEIQKLQFENKEKAEQATKVFLQEVLGEEKNKIGRILRVELRPSPVSLNSFSGTIEVENDKRYFFKSHTQSEEVVREYYNTSILADAGYPMIKPVFLSKKSGKQVLIYPHLKFRTMFDLVRECELKNEVPDRIIAAQAGLDKKVMGIYEKTWEIISGRENEKSPIHQLFYLRFLSRFSNFYKGKVCVLPGLECGFDELSEMSWKINGVDYGTLNEIITRAEKELKPKEADSVIGHGDAHLGNVMLDNKGKLLLFDPAFAGRHSPLLDFVKPLFHNTFAEWMYFPESGGKVELRVEKTKGGLDIRHNFRPSRIRLELFDSKIREVVIPVVRKLSKEESGNDSIRSFIKSALFACSFLTTNLLDRERYDKKLGLLGLAVSVQFGSLKTAENQIGGELWEYLP